MSVPGQHRCPFCGVLHDDATQIAGESAGPAPGDISLCLECGEWSVFTDGVDKRPCNDEELDFIGNDRTCRAARSAWVMTQEQRKP